MLETYYAMDRAAEEQRQKETRELQKITSLRSRIISYQTAIKHYQTLMIDLEKRGELTESASSQYKDIIAANKKTEREFQETLVEFYAKDYPPRQMAEMPV